MGHNVKINQLINVVVWGLKVSVPVCRHVIPVLKSLRNGIGIGMEWNGMEGMGIRNEDS